MSNSESLPGFCAKDNIEADMDKGCKHPTDFCQHRSSCMIHFIEKERGRDKNRKNGDNLTENKE